MARVPQENGVTYVWSTGQYREQEIPPTKMLCTYLTPLKC